MKWKFLKTNWFSIAVVVLLILTIARKNLTVFFGGGASPQPKEHSSEKYTAADNNSLLDFSSESSKQVNARPDEATAVAFLKRFGHVAVSERKKFGVPASVLLACAYVNSFAGQRISVEGANNFFAVPCTSDWEGEKVTSEGRCLRRYESAWASFRDFSVYLTSQEWFGSVRKSAGKDWRAWVKELDSKNISDVSDFGKEAEKVIEAYRLYDLDSQ